MQIDQRAAVVESRAFRLGCENELDELLGLDEYLALKERALARNPILSLRVV